MILALKNLTKGISVVAWAVALGVLVWSSGAAWAQAIRPSMSVRDAAFAGYVKSFYVSHEDGAYFKDKTGGGDDRNSNFWQNAEMIEVAEDDYDRTRSSAAAGMVEALCDGFLSRYTAGWSGNPYNDDMLWACIAFARAQTDTGKARFGQIGARNFDTVWKRGWDSVLGGGLWWNTDRKSKNACVNGPGAIAGMLLYSAGFGAGYLAEAKQCYAWERSHLVDTSTGRVNDHLNADGSIGPALYTYNQGTWIGASALLYRLTKSEAYSRDGRLALMCARQSLTGGQSSEILSDECRSPAGDSDGAGFKSILARWAGKWVECTGDGEFNDWLRQNADAVWRNRNVSNIIWSAWGQRTPDSVSLSVWECASGCAMLLDCP